MQKLLAVLLSLSLGGWQIIFRNRLDPDNLAFCQTVFFHTSFSTIDDPDWNQDYFQRPASGNLCNGPSWNGKQTGIAQYLDNDTQNGSCDGIIVAANYPSGLGGRGFRHWRGDGGVPAGQVANDVGGGLKLIFPATEHELYIRYVSRWKSGFAWTANTPEDIKEMFWGVSGGIFNFGQYAGFGGGVGMRIVVNPTFGSNSPTNYGWNDIMNGNVGDDLQHTYEWHLKIDSGNTANGVGELKIDNVLRLSHANINYTNTSIATGWPEMVLGSNGKYPNNNNVDGYQDYDEIAVSRVGWIGPYKAACGY